MINAKDLIYWFQYALVNLYGYIWGTCGQLWTQAKQDAATREMTVAYGKRWIGHYVVDCSGLFVFAFKKLGASIYHGSDTIWKKYCSAKGKLLNGARADGQPIKPGTAVFLYDGKKRHHIGLYIGDDTCIEAKGTRYGVVTSKLNHWDEWGELKDVDYTNSQETIIMQTLKKGSSGEAVKALQIDLNEMGYDCGTADGVFGSRTAAAVKQFQADHELTADGIVGPKTLNELAYLGVTLPNEAPDEPDEEPDDDMIAVDREQLLEWREQMAEIIDELDRMLR